MGIQGLWRYLDNHNLTRHLGASSDKLEPQHLLLDMNSIMHKAYDPKRPTVEATVDAVLREVKTFVTKFPPSKSLTLTFDGVAPTAKIPTQRERRRKTIVGLTTATQKGIQLQQGQIVTGSTFVRRCEEAVVRLVRKLVGQGEIKTEEPVFVSSYQSPGEGDTKIFKRLHALAADALEKKVYDPNDIVVIVGSDCDLVLGCAACTPFHNMFLMSPLTHLLTDIGELFTHWMKRSSGDMVPIDLLPSLRIDFVFCVALAGGDHFNGLEDRAIELWRRYRHLRLDGGFYRKPLISNSSFDICWDLLTQMVSRDRKALLANFSGSKHKKARKKAELAKEAETGGNGDIQSGIDLLKGALWSLAAYAEGIPPAMDAKFYSANPKPSSIRVACARGRQHVSVPRSEYKSLPPISVYLGAVGVKSITPYPFDEIMGLPIHKNFATLTSASAILAHVRQMIHTATKSQDGALDIGAVSSEALNRTDEDDLLDNAIQAAHAAKEGHVEPTKNQVSLENDQSEPVCLSNNAKRKVAKEKEKQAQLEADARVSSLATFPTIPDEVKPLLESRPEHEWMAIKLTGPVVPKKLKALEYKPGNAVTLEQRKTSKTPAPVKNQKTATNLKAKKSQDSVVPTMCAPPSVEDEASVVAAIESAEVTRTVIKDALITKFSTRKPDQPQVSLDFCETLNTIDFKYPEYVTTVQISSVIVHRNKNMKLESDPANQQEEKASSLPREYEGESDESDE